MGEITDIRSSKNKRIVDVFLDGRLSFSINRETAIEAGLKVSQNLSMSRIAELKEADINRRCFEVALHCLGYRPRSESEVRTLLYRRGFRGDVVSKIIVRLKAQSLLDDVAFAQYWKDNRISFNPRSRRLIKHELVQKGVSKEIADEISGDLDDEVNAYKAGEKRARILADLEYTQFYRRLSNYLGRRGFNYEVVDRVSSRLWQEQQSSSK